LAILKPAKLGSSDGNASHFDSKKWKCILGEGRERSWLRLAKPVGYNDFRKFVNSKTD
jgi:hypothetical protein